MFSMFYSNEIVNENKGRRSQVLGSTDTNTDADTNSDTDKGHNICGKNKNMELARTRKKYK